MMTPALLLRQWFGRPALARVEPTVHYHGDRMMVTFGADAVAALPLVQRILDQSLLGYLHAPRINRHNDVKPQELLWMRLLLPGHDPESADISDARVVMSAAQYAKLKRWLGTELQWVQQHNRTLLLDVPADVLLTRLRTVMDAILRRSIISPWNDIREWER